MASKLNLRQAALLSVASIALSSLAQSQAIAQTAQSAGNIEEVVVTGTMIRGINPPGSNVVGISQDQIQSLGANNAAQILASIPQATSFNNYAATLPAFNVAVNSRVPIARPNLRNLPFCDGAASGACTLILIDGHRIVPEGLQQTAVDPQVIPTGIIERVETILDGNSAIYGSDAIGGVINFITKKHFDGTQADAHYGFMSGSQQVDASVTSGHAWDKGSVVLTYTFAKSDPLLRGARDWAKAINYTTDRSFTGRACDIGPTVTAAGVTYPVTNGVVNTAAPGTFNQCDNTAFSSLSSAELHNGGAVTLTQDITDTVKFELNAMYNSSKLTQYVGPFTGTATITTRNPYFQPIGAATSESVQLSYGPLLGDEASFQQTSYELGQITPTITVDVGSWQVRTSYTYGKSHTSYANPNLNTTVQSLLISGPTGSTAAIPVAAALNPYNLLGTTNTALFSGLLRTDRGDGIDEMDNFRSIADGKVVTLPGGDLHAAIGVEWQKQRWKTRVTNQVSFLLNDYVGVTQNAYSGFGELNIPIVGASNSRPGIESLVLDVSGRYDKYSGVSGKFVPKVGATYEPIDWITVRGNWGKSFNAPTPADVQGQLAANTIIQAIPITVNSAVNNIDPQYLPLTGANNTHSFLFMSGDQRNLKPQNSANWSIGGDIHPPIMPDLTLSATYYKISMHDIISLPTPTGDTSYLWKYYSQLLVQNPCTVGGRTTLCSLIQNGQATPALAAYLAQAADGGAAALAQAAASGTDIVQAIDDRVGNVGEAFVQGIDFSVRYDRKTSFGSVDGTFAGNYRLKRILHPGGTTFIDDLYQSQYPPMNFNVVLGANIGEQFRAQATWNHTSGMNLVPASTLLASQTTLGSFNTVDLFFRYDVNGMGLAKDLTLTLTVNNLTDTAPPLYQSNGNFAPQNGPKSLGRLVQFGVSKKF